MDGWDVLSYMECRMRIRHPKSLDRPGLRNGRWGRVKPFPSRHTPCWNWVAATHYQAAGAHTKYVMMSLSVTRGYISLVDLWVRQPVFGLAARRWCWSTCEEIWCEADHRGRKKSEADVSCSSRTVALGTMLNGTRCTRRSRANSTAEPHTGSWFFRTAAVHLASGAALCGTGSQIVIV